MKKFFSFTILGLLFMFLQSNVNAQCTVTAMIDTIPWNAPKHICLGDSVDINSKGTCGFLMNNNFNNSQLGAGWQTNITALWTNPCTPNGLPSQSVVLWFGSNIFPRELITVGYDMSLAGCAIDWDMKYAANIGGSTNCESPDEPTEGIHLMYSVNNGTTWTQFAGTDQAPTGTYGVAGYVSGSGGYWTPVSGNAATGPYYTWNHYHNAIPAAATSANTKIRWYQDLASGNNFDHWGVDNVQISCPAYAYVEWSYDGVVSSYAYNPPPVHPTTAGTHLYIVTVLDLLSGLSAIDTITVIVHKPVVMVNTTLDTMICIGDTAVLSAGGNGLSNYQWNTNPITANDTLIVTPLTTSVYIVQAQDNIGCKAKDTVMVTVNPLPVIFTTSDTACIGDTAVLKASAGIGDTYLWTTVNKTTASISVSPATTTTYEVKVTTPMGCVDSSFATAIINPLPIIQISENKSICLGDQATLTASGGNSYLWNTTEITPSISVSPTVASTTYSVIVTDLNNCIDSASVDVNTIQLPVPTISQEIDTLCKGVYTTITAGGGSTYLWNTGEITPSIYVRPLSTFIYVVTVSNTLNNVICSKDIEIQQVVRNCNVIYVPNSFSPTGYNTTFKPIGDIVITKSYHFSVYNRWGQMVFETTDINQGWDGRFNGEYVPMGAYIYYLQIDNGYEEPYEKIGTVTIVN